MNNSAAKNESVNAPKAESKGFFNAITGAVSSVLGNKKNAKNAINQTKKNNSKMSAPVTAGVNAPTVSTSMSGGVAPSNFRYPSNMQQPSEAVMEWATTAGAPMPSASEMRNVARGGKRRTRRHGKKHHSKKHGKTHKCKTHRRKSHRRRHHKRRN